MYVHKTPVLVKWLFPRYTWTIPTQEKVIYLTFDDGPIPGVTEWVLEVLDTFGAKATFFCVGDNVRKHPEVFAQLHQRGHATGNHTFNHLNGWKTEAPLYLANVEQCRQVLNPSSKSSLFRPPYGRLSRQQARPLLAEYHIIMWDVLSGDFDAKLPAETCLQRTIQATSTGSIVVFHDSLKAEKNLRYVLPRYLAHFANLNYRFAALHENSLA